MSLCDTRGCNDIDCSLNSKHGTHWTQLFSVNPEIALNPDVLHEGQVACTGFGCKMRTLDRLLQLIHLGNVYEIQEGDSLTDLALQATMKKETRFKMV